MCLLTGNLFFFKITFNGYKKLQYQCFTFGFINRIEDVTDPESLSKDPNCDRKVCLYGYARGGALKKDSYYHIPGIFNIYL